MRNLEQAPVDTMGCGVELKKDVSKEDRAFHTLISLMLSAQTKDEVTHATTKTLVNDHNLSVQTIINTSESTLNTWISKVGFHNKKANYIKQAT
jgi:endonuclease III